jgi:hypothetical protein
MMRVGTPQAGDIGLGNGVARHYRRRPPTHTKKRASRDQIKLIAKRATIYSSSELIIHTSRSSPAESGITSLLDFFL